MISFYGASVTQQKSGYAVKLRSKLKEDVKIFGYGGMHLNDAAICYVDKIVAMQPELCFIDWFSTAYIEKNDSTIDYLDTIVEKFTKINCKLVFLFFLNADHKNRISFYSFCKKYLINKGIAFCDLNEFIDESSELLRDNVHTTEYGSEKYSEIILKFLRENRYSIKVAVKPKKTIYSEISEKKINRIYTKNLKLSGNGKVIGFLLTIGPHSGLIKVINKEHVTNFNTWDQWCHYNRKHFNISFVLENNDVILEVLDDDFDTSSCRNSYLSFENYKKKIIVHSIFHTGKIKVENSFFNEYKSSMLFLVWKINLKKNQIIKLFIKALTLCKNVFYINYHQ